MWTKGARWYFDSEANSLVPDRFHCFVAKSLDTPEVVRLTPETIHLVPSFFADAKLLIAHHSIGFDVPNLERVFNFEVDRSKVRDTLVMSRLANSRRGVGESGPPVLSKKSHSIEAWGVRFGLHKPEIESWDTYTPEMLVRCERDVDIGILVLKHLLGVELRGFSKASIDNEHDLAWLLMDMERAGFYLEREKAHRLYTTTKALADGFQEEIRHAFPRRLEFVREVVPKITKDGGFSKAQTRCLGPDWEDSVGGPFSLCDHTDFNIDSPLQRVSRLLGVGWEPRNYTKPSKTHPEGLPQFTAEDIEEQGGSLPPEAQIIGKYLLCRSRERLASSWLDLVDKNSYVHGKVTHIGTYTQRMSHSQPNLGNPPKVHFEDDDVTPKYGLDGFFGFECRDAWGADPRIPDQVLLGMDLTAIQLRGFAHYVGDLDYIDQICSATESIHKFHGGILEVDKKRAKTWLYAWLLGAGFKKQGLILGGSLKDGKNANDKFMERIPGVRTLRETLIPKWASQGYLVALDGRRVPAPSAHLAFASALQSFEKCVFSHSLCRLKKWTDANKMDYQPRAVPHDEVEGTCPSKYALDIGEKFKDIVAQVGRDLGSLAPLTAECKMGLTWAACH